MKNNREGLSLMGQAAEHSWMAWETLRDAFEQMIAGFRKQGLKDQDEPLRSVISKWAATKKSFEANFQKFVDEIREWCEEEEEPLRSLLAQLNKIKGDLP